MKPMFNKQGFGRDLFVSGTNERIRELGESVDSKDTMNIFDLNLYNKRSNDIYSRRVSQKSVTGVTFYKRDIK